METYNNGIPLATGLKIEADTPVDDRTVVPTFEDLDLINRKYDGLPVYVQEEKKVYIYDLPNLVWIPQMSEISTETGLVSIDNIEQNDNIFTFTNIKYLYNSIEFDIPLYQAILNPAAINNYRIDILVGDNTGESYLIEGEESTTNAIQPIAPVNTTILSIFNIFGESYNNTTPINSNDFLLKSREAQQVIYLEGNFPAVTWSYETTFRWKGNANFTLHSFYGVLGLTLYDGKLFTLIHDGNENAVINVVSNSTTSGTSIVKFFISGKEDNSSLVLNKGDIVVFKYSSNTSKLEFVSINKSIEGLVESVTGEIVDNTDPTNPIISIPLYIYSNENLSLAKRKGNILYGILDQYTGEDITLFKVPSLPSGMIVDNIIYFQLGNEYFKRFYLNGVSVDWFGAKGDGVTDDHNNILKAINYIVLVKSGKVIFSGKTYLTSPIEIPFINPQNNLGGILAIELTGVAVPPQTFGTMSTIGIQDLGTVLKCNSTTPGESVIRAGFIQVGTFQFSRLKLIVNNMTIRTYDNPIIGGIDARYASQCMFDNLNIDTGVYSVQATEPTTPEAMGLRTSRNNNGAISQIGNVSISGYSDGIDGYEHTFGYGQVNITGCKNGFRSNAGSHSMYFSRLTVQNCTTVIKGTGISNLVIDQLNVEHLRNEEVNNNAWQQTIYDIDDPTGLIRGYLNWTSVKSGTGNALDFVKNGGGNLKCRSIDSGYLTGINYDSRIAEDGITLRNKNTSALWFKGLSYINTSNLGFYNIGAYGIGSTFNYGYIGFDPSTPYNNAVFKIAPVGLVGINVPTTQLPSCALDVRGLAKFTYSDADTYNIKKETIITNSPISSLAIGTKSAGDMVAGFGTGILFQIEDLTSGAINAGAIRVIREGADNTSSLRLASNNAGSLTEYLQILSTGIISAINGGQFQVVTAPVGTNTLQAANTAFIQQELTALALKTKTGTSTQSGNGTTTVFNIAHGLGAIPTYFNAIPTLQGAGNISYFGADATNIIINYSVAPPVGTNNLRWNWLAR